MLRALFLFLILTSVAHAGPWPRDLGEGFLSFSLDVDAEDGEDNFFGFYLEYGIGRNITLGAERYQSMDDVSKTVVFLRFPVGPPDRDLKLSYEVGLGAVDGEAALRPGFSVGRGLTMGERNGWWAWDTRVILFEGFEDGHVESDVTFGLQVTPRTKLIAQLQAGAPHDHDPYAKIATSVAIGNGKGLHYQFGVTAGVIEEDDIKINLGIWRKF